VLRMSRSCNVRRTGRVGRHEKTRGHTSALDRSAGYVSRVAPVSGKTDGRFADGRQLCDRLRGFLISFVGGQWRFVRGRRRNIRGGCFGGFEIVIGWGGSFVEADRRVGDERKISRF